MMRRMALLISLLALALPLAAAPYAYLSASGGLAYDTNAFSSPLPIWNEDDMNFDYERRTSALLSLDADVFFNDGPAGLSVKAVLGVPLLSEKALYDGNGYIWGSSDAISSLSFSIGPVFRYRMGIADLFLSIRFGVGSYDFFSSGFTFDMLADGGVRFFTGERLVITAGAIYDAHLMKYLSDSMTALYDQGYIMLSIGGYVSIGVRIGG